MSFLFPGNQIAQLAGCRREGRNDLSRDKMSLKRLAKASTVPLYNIFHWQIFLNFEDQTR